MFNKKNQKQKTTGTSGMYIICCNHPGMKFLYEPLSPEWLALKEEEKAGTLHIRVPHLNKPRAGDLMTEAMLNAMMVEFDMHGEFHTQDKALAITAYDVARDVDRNARLHSTSLPIDESLLKEVKPGSLGYVPPPPISAMSVEQLEDRVRQLERQIRANYE